MSLLPGVPTAAGTRSVVLLQGCVQPGLAAEINAALERILQHLGISVQRCPEAGCCGALAHHLSDTERARAMARRNIDAWYPAVDAPAKDVTILATAGHRPPFEQPEPFVDYMVDTVLATTQAS